jgi:hypothetical protein
LHGLGINIAVAHRIPTTRLHALARLANTAKVCVVRRLPESRRLATFVGNLEAAALDDALDFRRVSDSLAPNRRDWYMLQRLLSVTAPHESIP